jgi:polysaccharide export outer membrane protein
LLEHSDGNYLGPMSLMKLLKGLLLAVLALGGLARPGLAQGPQTGATEQEYVRPGDVVKLWVWREEELSGEFLVPETGVVVFPKIGPQTVTEQPMHQLRERLLAEFQKYLRNPSVEISFLRRVNILGAVRKPGVYPLEPTMTVAMAIAMAEGSTPEGRMDRVELLRDGQRLVANINQRTRIAELPIQSGDQLYVPERSWISRNSALFATLVSSAFSIASLIIALNSK